MILQTRTYLRGSKALLRPRAAGRNGKHVRTLLTTSFAHGPTEVSPLSFFPFPIHNANLPQPPLLDLTIPQHFAQIVSQHGDRDAVVSRAQNSRLTYEELDKRSCSIAKTLQELGVKKGDRVAVSLGNNLEFGAVSEL